MGGWWTAPHARVLTLGCASLSTADVVLGVGDKPQSLAAAVRQANRAKRGRQIAGRALPSAFWCCVNHFRGVAGTISQGLRDVAEPATSKFFECNVFGNRFGNVFGNVDLDDGSCSTREGSSICRTEGDRTGEP